MVPQEVTVEEVVDDVEEVTVMEVREVPTVVARYDFEGQGMHMAKREVSSGSRGSRGCHTTIDITKVVVLLLLIWLFLILFSLCTIFDMLGPKCRCCIFFTYLVLQSLTFTF